MGDREGSVVVVEEASFLLIVGDFTREEVLLVCTDNGDGSGESL